MARPRLSAFFNRPSNVYRLTARLLATLAVVVTAGDHADAACSSPVANIGALDFQSTVFKYCDGTNWVALGGDGSATLNSLTAGTAANTIDSTQYAQTWNWSTITTGNALTLANTYNNAAATGNVLKLATTGASAAAVPLMITNNGTGYALRINDDGADSDSTPLIVDSAGSVGIGLTAPNGHLHAYSPSNNVAIISETGFSGGYGKFSAKAGSNNFSLEQYGTTGSTTLVPTGGALITTNGAGGFVVASTHASGDIKLVTGGYTLATDERMRIDSSGKVGIGTTTPSGILHVHAGTAAASTNGTHIILAAQVAGSGNQNGGAIYLRPGAKTGTGTPGAVVIGTSAVPSWLPANSLYAEGDMQADTFTSGDGIVSFGNGTTIMYGESTGTPSADYFRLSVGIGERLRVKSNGHTGIGTNAPVARLDLNETTAGSISLQVQSGGTLSLRIMNPSGGITNTWNAANSVMYVARDTGTSRSINAAGTVNASGADFAEWVDWTGSQPDMGSVIKYRGSYVVVSSPHTAAFIGNDTKDPANAILVAFAGQLPVWVRGPTSEGDLIVANDDGTARAISKSQATLLDVSRAVGTAWASSSYPNLKRVHVAVGIGLAGGMSEIAALARTKADRAEIESLRAENEDLNARIERLERLLGLPARE